MRAIDITLPLDAHTPAWPGDPAFALDSLYTVAQDGVAVSRLSLGSHTGTHVDAPAHLHPGGATVDGLAVERLCGPAWVAHLPTTAHVTEDDLARVAIPDDCRRLLLRTANSERGPLRSLAFDPDYLALTAEAAAYLTARGLWLVGIDALSVDPFTADDLPAHRALLDGGVIVVEGLNLTAAAPGSYWLACLPLRLVGADGAPTRAVLFPA
jgi:arylformamidase